MVIFVVHPSGNSGFHDANSRIEGGRAAVAGGILLSFGDWNQSTWSPKVACTVNHTDQASSVHILNTEIVRKAAIKGVGGLGIALSLCRKYTIRMRNITMDSNIVGAIGESSKWWQQFPASWPWPYRKSRHSNFSTCTLPLNQH